jgi:tetratricopeptide (TPR) repeat protein
MRLKSEPDPESAGDGFMKEQLTLFGEGLSFMEHAERAMEDLDLEDAGLNLAAARSVNPWLARLDTAEKFLRLMKTCFGTAGTAGARLAGLWRMIPECVADGTMTAFEARWAGEIVARSAVKLEKSVSGFVGEGDRLHPGACLLSLKEPAEAQRILLETLDSNPLERTDLLGYYGDACLSLGRYREANTAYFQALLLDPHGVDLFRLKDENLLDLHGRLALKYRGRNASALLLFFGLMDGTFQPFDNRARSSPLWRKIIDLSESAKTERFHRFSLLALRDRTLGTSTEIRETMKTLAPELFSTYLISLSSNGANLEFEDLF